MPDPIPTATIYAHPCSDVDWKPEQPSEMRKARRIKGPIYEALLREFYQDGCYLGARHFECLVKLEQSLIEREQEIRYVYENKDFLLQLVENATAAEQIFHLDKIRGIYMSRRILNQIIVLAEREKFDWLTQALYTIIAKYMLKSRTNDYLSMEQTTRFIFKYGKFLMQQGKPEQLQEATIVIPIAMEAACDEDWKPDTSPEHAIFSTLHAALGNLLASLYLIKAKQGGNMQKHAIKHAQKALKAIAQGACELLIFISTRSVVPISHRFFSSILLKSTGIEYMALSELHSQLENKCIAYKAFLTKIEILMDAGRYDWALRELLLLEKSVMNAEGSEFVQTKLDLLKNIGITLYNLGQPIDAIENFGKALEICKINNYSHAEGDILLQIRHAQRRLPGGAVKARLAFELAKTKFECQGDKSKALSTKYLIAALKSDLMHYDLKQLIHSNAYCDYFKLRRWKNRCQPFWEVEKQAGHIKQDVLASISMYSSENLYKLYYLVLNTPATIAKVEAVKQVGDAKSAYSEEISDLDHAVEKNLYYSDVSVSATEAEIEAEAEAETEAEEEQYEYEQNPDYSNVQDIEQSDTSQKIPHVTVATYIRRYSFASGSRRSSQKYVWTVKDLDPICCLLRES